MRLITQHLSCVIRHQALNCSQVEYFYNCTARGPRRGLGAVLSFTSSELKPGTEEAFAGILSVVAVALVTWMVFWMKRTARNLKRELERKIDRAVTMGSLAMAITAFVAVGREGIETSLFIYSNFTTVKSSFGPSVGLVLGLAAAIGRGYLIYRQTVPLSLTQFFKITGIALIGVAAGVLDCHHLAAGGHLVPLPRHHCLYLPDTVVLKNTHRSWLGRQVVGMGADLIPWQIGYLFFLLTSNLLSP